MMNIRACRILFFAVVVVGLGQVQTGRAAEQASEANGELARALTLHASFDKGLEADFSRGDKTCYDLQGKETRKAAPTAEGQLAPETGRFGRSLHITKR